MLDVVMLGVAAPTLVIHQNLKLEKTDQGHVLQIFYKGNLKVSPVS
jgi:hypothetical protein